MEIYIGLFRGINVGGRNILPMADLNDLLTPLGLQNIKTYIQSGNVVFQYEKTDFEKLTNNIKSAILKIHGFSPEILILSLADFQDAISANPYPKAEPKTLHFFFLAANPSNPALDKMDEIKINEEKYSLKGRVFYLYAPAGIGRSKLAARAEKILGVPTTARNWRTVNKILDLSKEF